VHPAGRATIDAWLGDMNAAADHGDAVTVARLAKLVTDKIEQELAWQREDDEPNGAYAYSVGKSSRSAISKM
jgi:hypothetical protein